MHFVRGLDQVAVACESVGPVGFGSREVNVCLFVLSQVNV